MEAKYKVGVIGVGRIGALLEEDRLREKPCSHVGAWKSISGVDVVAIADPDTQRGDAVAAKWSVREHYADYKDLLSYHNFDVVSVATPTETHADIVTTIAKKRRARLIFCEKPIADNIRDATRMVQTCQKYGVKLAINHTRRWDPIYQDIASTLHTPHFGNPLAGVAYFTGDVINDGVHIADLLNWYELTEKVTVFNQWLKDVEYVMFELDIVCQKGRLRVSENGEKYELWTSVPSDHYEGLNELRPVHSTVVRAETPMLSACRQLIHCLDGGSPLCTGQHGLNALELALKWKEHSI